MIPIPTLYAPPLSIRPPHPNSIFTSKPSLLNKPPTITCDLTLTLIECAI